jgi:hypothetical protein
MSVLDEVPHEFGREAVLSTHSLKDFALAG